MLEWLNSVDTQLFYWVNSHHCIGLDWFLWIFTTHLSWFAVLVLFFVLVTLRREPRQWWVVLLGIALCFLLSDRISVLCFKDVFCRLRPCHALENVRMFRLGCGGQYGFVSSHASNSFALSLFLALRYRPSRCQIPYDNSNGIVYNKKMSWLAPASILIWAFVTSYSRVYLGKHYPGDILCGALLGIIIGSSVYLLLQKIPFLKKQ
ncbi:MAG: phosphatase PAP2 family protein [Bacteroidales bacterium]|nr:phosphatase PAP2 family protein [Bacteroidales bacterium]